MAVVRILGNGRFARWVAVTLFAVIIAPPLAMFLYDAIAGLSAGSAAKELMAFSWSLLGTSFLLAAVSSLVCVVVGGLCGLAAGRMHPRAALVVLFCFVVPLATPPAIHAYVWRNIAMSAGLLGGLFVEGGAGLLNFCGAAVSMVSAYWTLPAIAAFAVAAGPGRRYELEGRTFADTHTLMRRILLPAVLPAVVTSAGLVFILSFSDYGAAALWQVNTYPVHILSLYSSFYEPRLAAAASLVPSLVNFALAGLVALYAARTIRAASVEKTSVERALLWRPSALFVAAVAVCISLLVGVLLAVSTYWAVSEFRGIGSLRPIAIAFVSSILVACIAAACGAFVAVVMVADAWSRSRTARVAPVVMALVVFLLPAAGIAYSVKTISDSRLVPGLFSDTSAAYVYALAARFLAVPLMLTALAMSRVPRGYLDLARAGGVSGLNRVFKLAAPLVLPAALAGFVISVVLAVADIPVATFLAPAGRQPVSVSLFNLMHFARQGDAFAAALAMMLGSSVCLIGSLAGIRLLWKRYSLSRSV